MAPYIIILFLIIYISVGIFLSLRTTVSYFAKGQFNRYLINRKIKPAYKKILVDYFRYYHTLDADNKLHFEKRVQKFIDIKRFEPRGVFTEVTDEMAVLIAASAIQLTFGYPGVYFKHFWRILVYPENYYSKITQHYHKGEVNSKGFIVLSWENFLKGYMDTSDGINLALHEMAHALRLENSIKNDEYQFIDHIALKEFDRLGKIETVKIHNGSADFFRVYATENPDEFFSIAIENFFERSAAFKAHNHELYIATAKVLRQDPLR